MLEEDIRELKELIEADAPVFTEPPTPEFPLPIPSLPSIPGLGALTSWLRDRLADLEGVVRQVAGAVRDAALAAVQATLPTLAEVALALLRHETRTLDFIGSNLAELGDVVIALTEGVGGGLESAAGEMGNRIASAAGNVLSGVLRPLIGTAADIPTLEAFELELGPRA
jgi:hypothetical protein